VLFDLVDDGRVAVVTLNRPDRCNAYDVPIALDGLGRRLSIG
jgi:hypothetical protein